MFMYRLRNGSDKPMPFDGVDGKGCLSSVVIGHSVVHTDINLKNWVVDGVLEEVVVAEEQGPSKSPFDIGSSPYRDAMVGYAYAPYIPACINADGDKIEVKDPIRVSESGPSVNISGGAVVRAKRKRGGK